MGELAMVIKSRTQPGRRDDVMRLYQELLGPRAEANPAQEFIVLAADQQDADVFYLFEIYTDMAALGANAQAPWFAEYMTRVGPMLAVEPEVGMASPVWSKGIEHSR